MGLIDALGIKKRNDIPTEFVSDDELAKGKTVDEPKITEGKKRMSKQLKNIKDQ